MTGVPRFPILSPTGRMPRAGQNPDPAWFGQRGRGERAEAARNAQAEELAAMIDERAVSALSDMFERSANVVPPGLRNARLSTERPDSQGSNITYGEARFSEWQGEALRLEPQLRRPASIPVFHESRQGDGWTLNVQSLSGQLSGSMSFDLRDVSLDELADAMAEALEGLRRKKKARVSFLHPGARKLRLE